MVRPSGRSTRSEVDVVATKRAVFSFGHLMIVDLLAIWTLFHHPRSGMVGISHVYCAVS